MNEIGADLGMDIICIRELDGTVGDIPRATRYLLGPGLLSPPRLS